MEDKMHSRGRALLIQWGSISKMRLAILSILYRLYQRRLLRQVRANPIPHHVGIILDGNRRYARRENMADAHVAYMAGAHKLDHLLEWCIDLGISAVTLWVLSTENLKRSPEEVSAILAAVETKLGTLATDRQIHNHRVRVRAVGRLDLLPPSTIAAARAAEAATEHYDGMTLTIAAAYGGRQEVVDAVRLLLCEQMHQGNDLKQAISNVTVAAIGRHLYAPDLPDPDLIIRTSGEIRLSGFLLWQSAHSEFYFTDVFWPAFRKIDFLRAIRAYQQRQRRFGR
jgi:short-chain Z-isoprenyl diphosphate synthase